MKRGRGIGMLCRIMVSWALSAQIPAVQEEGKQYHANKVYAVQAHAQLKSYPTCTSISSPALAMSRR